VSGEAAGVMTAVRAGTGGRLIAELTARAGCLPTRVEELEPAIAAGKFRDDCFVAPGFTGAARC
jgi:hypothetical protein